MNRFHSERNWDGEGRGLYTGGWEIGARRRTAREAYVRSGAGFWDELEFGVDNVNLMVMKCWKAAR